MCLLIYKNSNVIIPEAHLEEAFDNNSHGAGFTVRMVNEAGQGYLHRERGFFKYSDFIEAYRPFASNQGIIHFRLATAGLKDEDNCHPFEVNPSVHMGHNGIISISQSISKDKSDTWHYNELVCKPVYDLDNDKFWTCKALHFLLDQSIGSSKLAFLHEDGRYLLINEEAGHWDDAKNPAIWYSNDTYELPRYKHVSTYKGYSSPSFPHTHITTGNAVGFGSPCVSQSTSCFNADFEEQTTKKDLRRLERARLKLSPDEDWIVDEAYDAGLSAAEILEIASTRANAFMELFNTVYPVGSREAMMEAQTAAEWNASFDATH